MGLVCLCWNHLRLYIIIHCSKSYSPLCAQNIRGGRVKLSGIVSPEMEYQNMDKGDALYAMELALSLEVSMSTARDASKPAHVVLGLIPCHSVKWICVCLMTACNAQSRSCNLRCMPPHVKSCLSYVWNTIYFVQKLNFSRLRLLHDIACKHDDAQMADFIGEIYIPLDKIQVLRTRWSLFSFIIVPPPLNHESLSKCQNSVAKAKALGLSYYRGWLLIVHQAHATNKQSWLVSI